MLIRVTADLSVADGPDYEVLGLNLRGMVKTIVDRYVMPSMNTLSEVADDLWADAERVLNTELDQQIYTPVAPEPEEPKRAFSLFSWFGKERPTKPPEPEQPTELLALEYWKQSLASTSDPLHHACLTALLKVVGTMVAQRGRLVADRELVVRLCCRRVANVYGSEVIGVALEPYFLQGVKEEGYRLLPAREKPVIMNVKGASAAGKSTIRPQQRELAETLGIPWDDFALISPDYWRKYLLDYESLGDDYKYGAMLTGQELELIDKKLDRYMAAKAANGKMTHLLIDRFRFDSFSLENGRTADSQLLTRFGDRIFMFFMITPPAETVVRAWNRGLTTGRFKAVGDLLYHNVEAFTGMPSLFFAWIQSEEKKVHFEFLNNDVPLGEVPKTAAHGWGKNMVIMDVDSMINIDRYRKVNIDAQKADDVIDRSASDPLSNMSFIQRCTENLDFIEFYDRDSQQAYAQVAGGKLIWWDSGFLRSLGDQHSTVLTLQALGYDPSHSSGQRLAHPENLAGTQVGYRLGQ